MKRLRFVLALARREARGSGRSLGLLLAAVAVGIASLVAIRSFGDAALRAVRSQARSLLGADLVAGSAAPFTEDAERRLAVLLREAGPASAAGAQASIQINTGGECHLDAVMLHEALNQLDLTHFDLLIVENVGNLVCPANFKLGTHKTILVASVPEGDDKPYKYPGTYRGVDALVINKIDLLPYIPFKMDHFQRGVESLNPGLITFPLSCTTGQGLDMWIDWLIQNAKR